MTLANCTLFQSSNGSAMGLCSSSGGTTWINSSTFMNSTRTTRMRCSMNVGKSRTPAPELWFTGQVSQLTDGSNWHFLPKSSNIAAVKNKLVMLVGHILTEDWHCLVAFIAASQAYWSGFKANIKEYGKYKGGCSSQFSECNIKCYLTDHLYWLDRWFCTTQSSLTTVMLEQMSQQRLASASYWMLK